ncbi:ferredoxin [Candidatus Bathyarchaeota archaeon]|nr:ferredoxin [Candidatus Bathyarchaeota archaeon]
MTVIKSNDAELEAVLTAAKLMVASARTAPKALGIDKITAAIVTGDDKEKLADRMAETHEALIPKERMEKQVINVRNSDAVVLIGVKIDSDVNEVERILRLVDLGIAIGSAVKTASMLNIDNRVMYTVGKAAQDLKIIEGNVVFGIPISVKGSNIFFDRYDPVKASWQKKLPSR